MSQLVTADDILSSGGDHPEIAAKATQEQRDNSALLAARVSALLSELGYTKRPPINDGLRDANAGYGAPKSAHKEGKAVDFGDREKPGVLTLKAKIIKAGGAAFLKKHGLRMEHPTATPTWCHLDTRPGTSRIFHP